MWATMAEPSNLDIYNATIKLFGSEPEPAFEDPARQERVWGRSWGCDNDVGQIRAVLMHRPGDEFDVIDRDKRILFFDDTSLPDAYLPYEFDSLEAWQLKEYDLTKLYALSIFRSYDANSDPRCH